MLLSSRDLCLYLYCFGTENTNYFCSFLICFGGRGGVLIFLGHTQKMHKQRQRHTETCGAYIHSDPAPPRRERDTQCLPYAGVFNFPLISPSSVMVEINEFIAPSFQHKDTESLTELCANTKSTSSFSEVSSLFISCPHPLTNQRYICACRRVLKWLCVSESKHTQSHM